MNNLPPLLFNELSIFGVAENQKAELKKTVRMLNREELKRPDEELVRDLVHKFGVRVPVLKEAEIYATERETQVDVSQDPMRMIFDRSHPFYISATEITIHIPFDGEAVLFRVQPSTFSSSPPRAFVDDTELKIVYSVTNPQFNVKNDYENKLSQIKGYLDSLRESSRILENELGSLARLGLTERRRQLQVNTGLVDSLGLPIRKAVEPQQPESHPSAPKASKQHSRGAPSDSSWDVFISHASEDKIEIATPLALGLRALGFRVWYDDFSLSLGDSLRQAIDRGLSKSNYGVVILSENFFAKHWPQQELNGLATREVNGKKVILPVWHNVTLEGVREFSPTLADRVAARSSEGLESVTARIANVIRPHPCE
jgi:hypothetical protein